MNDQIRRQKLKPCPFCGGDKIRLTNWGLYRCWCANCLAQAADEISKKDAVEAWNKRAEPQGNWIPCSERLPDTEEEVWVILGYTYKSDYTQKSIARYIRFENGEAHWCDNKWGYLEWEKYSDGHGGCSSYKVLAWMPAEPYKGVE